MKNTPTEYSFDWNDIAFASKKPLSSLKATFISAPREMSEKRIIQLVKKYLPKGNIIIGIAREKYISGFENQPQFKTLSKQVVDKIIDKVNNKSPNKIYTITYCQRDFNYILQKIKFARVVLINGSWKRSFHTLPEYYTLTNTQTEHLYESPFVDETEAKNFATEYAVHIKDYSKDKYYNINQMLELALDSSRRSFDTSFQVGAVLGKKTNKGYRYLAQGHNKIVPYETYAWHNGASREKYYSPPNDLNHYDAIHAEVKLILNSLEQKINLKDCTIFINVLPCPFCTRMLCETPIRDLYYQIDHSEEYAIKMLHAAGIKVHRVV